MAPTFIGNPYNNEISEDSDGIEDDNDWDDVIGQFPIPVIGGDSTEEDNIFYDDDDDEDDEVSIYHMIGGDDNYEFENDDFMDDDDDEDYDPTEDVLFSDDDLDSEPGPPIDYNYRGFIVGNEDADEDDASISNFWEASHDILDLSGDLTEDVEPQSNAESSQSIVKNEPTNAPTSETISTPSGTASISSDTISKSDPDST